MRDDEQGCHPKTPTGIATNGGIHNLMDPQPAYLEDIAPVLFRVRRWSGHGRFDPPTIGAHLLHVVQIMRVELNVRHLPTLLGGLLHDAHEAYTGDVSRPLKLTFRAMGTTAFDELEEAHMMAVAKRFGSAYWLMRESRVIKADAMGAGWESLHLFGHQDLGAPWGLPVAHSGLLCEPTVDKFLDTAEFLGAQNVRRPVSWSDETERDAWVNPDAMDETDPDDEET